MPTPGEKAQEAYKKYQETIQQYGDENHAAVKAAYDTWQQASTDAETQRREGAANVRKSISDYLNEGYQATDAILKSEDQRIADAEQEAIDQRNREEKAALWTGAGEVAASLANLIAVGGYNAVSQKYHSYQQDWMKKAEENWKANRARIDNMRDRQRALQQQMIQMKMNGGSTLANFDMGEINARSTAAGKQADAGLKAAVDLAGIKGQTAQAVAQAGLQGETTKISLDQQEQARKDAKAQHEAKINLQYDLHGFTTDPKTGRRVAPATGVTATGRVSGGSGSSSSILLSIPPTTEGGKGTRLTINSGSLIATINANVDLFKSNDQKAITRILRGTGSQDDKAKQLEQYIKTSPEILDLLKLSSLAVDEFDWGKTETTQAAEAPSQRSQGSVGSAADLDKLIGG